MLSLPRFGHFPAGKTAAGKLAAPAGMLLDFLLRDRHSLLEFLAALDSRFSDKDIASRAKGCPLLITTLDDGHPIGHQTWDPARLLEPGILGSPPEIGRNNKKKRKARCSIWPPPEKKGKTCGKDGKNASKTLFLNNFQIFSLIFPIFWRRPESAFFFSFPISGAGARNPRSGRRAAMPLC